MSYSFIFQSAKKTAEMLNRKEISAVEVLNAYIRHIESINPHINALVYPMFERAMEAAQKADSSLARGKSLGLLHGLPFTVKDHINVEGGRITAGTLGLKNYYSNYNATIVQRILDQGGIVMGLSNMPEEGLAYETDNLVYGRTNNPWDLSRTPGGSSGGESALVSLGGSPFGIGSDGGGSIRFPAHCTGLVGLKPSRGRVSLWGVQADTNGIVAGMGYLGPLARYTEDAAMITDIVRGTDGIDPHTIDMPLENYKNVKLKKLRIGFFTGANSDGINACAPEEDVKNVLLKTLQSLEHQVASIEEFSLDYINEIMRTWFLLFAGALGGDAFKGYLTHVIGSEKISPFAEEWAKKCDLQKFQANMLDYAGILLHWENLQRAFYALFRQYDVIISPVAAVPAPIHGTTFANWGNFVYTMLHNVTGLPALSVNGGYSANGLPIGVQLTGNYWREDHILAVADFIEQEVAGWKMPAFSETLTTR